MPGPKSKNRAGANRLLAAREEALLRARQAELREHAVLVAVEFTGERRQSKAAQAARAARAAAAVGRGEDEAGEGYKNSVAEVMGEPDSVENDAEAWLGEFQELARSAGAVIAAVLEQRRSRPDPATLIGQGKLEEIKATVKSTGASLVLFNHDLTPSQARNIEEDLPCTVIDRTQLILDIFARHARTREGQLQVELAQLEYQLPRLAGKGKAMSQLGGGIGTRGPGETKLETDKRKIRARIDHIREQIEGIRRIRRQQRQRREAVPVTTVALVGYTNAGKSTLFNALTGAAVLESARMFATLDPKLRQLQLPSRRTVLLSDTVGFIRSLPHALVTSFRATLEEVERAELLLHVRDASSVLMEEHGRQVEKVLAELEVGEKPVVQVLNKVDLVSEPERARLMEAMPGAVAVSGLKGEGMEELLAAMDRALTADPQHWWRRSFAYCRKLKRGSLSNVLAALERGAVLLKRRFEGNLVYVQVRGPSSLLERYRRFGWDRKR